MPANEFIIYIEGKERWHYKGGKGKFWKKSEKYSPNNFDEPVWQKFTRRRETTLNPANIVEILLDAGWEVTDVKIIN